MSTTRLIFIFILIAAVLFLGGRGVIKLFEIQNQKSITAMISKINNDADFEKEIQALLQLKFLTTKQKALLYYTLANELYINNEMQK